MKSLLNFLIKYHVFFLFLILEMFSITLIVRFNNFHRVSFLNSSNVVSATILNKYSGIVDYFHLKQINESLSEENARLRSGLQTVLHENIDESESFDRIDQKYLVVSAKVIRNTVNKQYNYLTLNKGAAHGVEPDMGVVCVDGVVGVVLDVSENYSTILSILNGRWAINAKLSVSNQFGPLQWDGSSPEYAYLEEIPYHVRVRVNEKVVTSGYSSIFPEGMNIGEVEEVVHNPGDSFQTIKIRLSVDYRTLFYVQVIAKTDKNERIELEKLTGNE